MGKATPRRALVTGAAGYIGSVLVRRLLAEGWAVLGLDSLRFGGHGLVSLFGEPGFEFVRGDLRDTELVDALLDRVEAVVHLAALVGDPACAREPELAEAVNGVASRALYDSALAREGVARFVFASTCSNYGRMDPGGVVDERSELRPVSLYARTKVAMEQHILANPGPADFVPVILRLATAFGISPRMRFDLTVSHFTRDAHAHAALEVYGEQFWRPYCHVSDLARACAQMLCSPAEQVRAEVFGVGDSRENYQKRTIAELVAARLPATQIRYVERRDDPRDYRVDFSKIATALFFSATRGVTDGVAEVAALLEAGVVDDPFAARYRNV